jgi:hypothetical protein
MTQKTIKPAPPCSDMGFDAGGRPLPLAPDAVRELMTRAIDDPESELMLIVLRYRGDLLLQVMGPPSRGTLSQLHRVLQQLVEGYAHMLKGQ